MDKELLHDLLTVNRDVFKAATSRIRQQTGAEIEGAMCEASVFATELEDDDPTIPFKQICAIAETRARKHIREIREAARDQIQNVKREFELRQQSIRAFCIERAETLQIHRAFAKPSPTDK